MIQEGKKKQSKKRALVVARADVEYLLGLELVYMSLISHVFKFE